MTSDRTAAASAAHGAACQELVRQGWADHVYQYARHARAGSGDMYIPVCHCGRESRYHSPDMVDFDALPEERKAYFSKIAESVIDWYMRETKIEALEDLMEERP